MKIVPHQIKVRDLVDGYENNDESGVVGYHGKLDIRPPYQREFVYDEKKRNAVLTTVNRGFPLSIMYWVVKKDGGFEVLDGQQRTISIAKYVDSEFAIDGLYFHNLPEDKKQHILDYELTVYFCEGDDSERLEWFRVVNIAGEKLTEQELLNAQYSGAWLTDAKSKFSKTNCVAYRLANDQGALMVGTPIRQDYLETVLGWISHGNIQDYMGKHQPDPNADELWAYFRAVIDWVRKLFPHYRASMKGVAWGELYNTYKAGKFDPSELEAKVAKLTLDNEVGKKSGIYPYLFTGDEKYLSLRAFDDQTKQEAYERQKGICPACKKHFAIGEMEADHIDPWHEGGKTELDNCQMLCKQDNRRKGGR